MSINKTIMTIEIMIINFLQFGDILVMIILDYASGEYSYVCKLENTARILVGSLSLHYRI